MNTLDTEMQKLSEQFGVNVHDLKCLANSIINSLQQDNSVQTYLKMDADDQTDMIQAYAVHAFKKMDQFHAIYTTRPEARNELKKAVLALL